MQVFWSILENYINMNMHIRGVRETTRSCHLIHVTTTKMRQPRNLICTFVHFFSVGFCSEIKELPLSQEWEVGIFHSSCRMLWINMSTATLFCSFLESSFWPDLSCSSGLAPSLNSTKPQNLEQFRALKKVMFFKRSNVTEICNQIVI